MKQIRIKTATWIFLLLFLVGCNSLESSPDLSHALDCEVRFTKNAQEYCARLEWSLAGGGEFQLYSPDSMKDMTVVTQQDTVTYQFGELTYSIPTEQDISLFSLIIHLLEKTLRGDGITWETTQKQFAGRGEYNQVAFRVVCEKSTNRILSMVTQDGLQVDFVYNE